MRKKVTIVGAGSVGSTAAQWVAAHELADVVLVDVIEGLPQGKALDLLQAGPVAGFQLDIVGSNDYETTANSDVVVITAGVPRRKDPKTGQYPTREELVAINQKIITQVTQQVVKYSPETIIIVVTNPLDAMCHVALQVSGFDCGHVIGQAGALDTARYKTFVAMELDVSVEDVSAMVLGGHGDTMVPLPNHTSINGIPVMELMDRQTLDAIIERTRKGGGEIVGLMGASAYYAPASATVGMVDAILKDKKRIIPCATCLNGEYGYHDIFMGVPCVLGANGVERVIEMKLGPEEKAMLDHSAEAVRELISLLK